MDVALLPAPSPFMGEGRGGGTMHGTPSSRTCAIPSQQSHRGGTTLVAGAPPPPVRRVKFRRQQPLGPYFADFTCIERQLVIEVDGNHHAEQRSYDDARDSWMRSRGLRVLRFSNREVLTALESVEQAVWHALTSEPPP